MIDPKTTRISMLETSTPNAVLANRRAGLSGETAAQKKGLRGLLQGIFCALLLTVALPAAKAQATWTVTLLTDTNSTDGSGNPGLGAGYINSGNGSYDLRYALNQAIAAGGTQTIEFSASCTVSTPCTITLSNPLPPVLSYSSANPLILTIDGGEFGQVIVDGASLYRVFFVDENASVTLANLQIQNALAQGGAGGSGLQGGGGGGMGAGAGLFVNQSSASVTVRNTYFLNCKAVGGAGGGSGAGEGGGGGGGMGGFAGGNGGGGGTGGGGGGGGMLSAGGSGGSTGSPDSTGGSGYGSNPAGGGGDGDSGGSGFAGAGGNGGGGGGSGWMDGNGGAGGFGGGGGGGGGSMGKAGAGGFGGGGGAGNDGVGQGGYGGGVGSGGFADCHQCTISGGGGAALGPAIFVNAGSVSIANSGTSGATATAGASGGQGATAGTAVATPVFNVQGSVNGSSTTGGVAGALPSSLPATHFSVSAPSSLLSSVAGSITVNALDSNGNRTSAYNGTVNLTATDADNKTVSISPVTLTLTSGAATTGSLILQKPGIDNTVIATDSVSSYITGTSGDITVSPLSFVFSTPAYTLQGLPFTFTVTVEDQFGNTLTSYDGTAHFTSSDLSAALPSNSTLTGGRGTFSAALNTVGSQTITATDTSNAFIKGTSNSTQVTVPVPSTATLTVSGGTPQTALVGTAFGTALQATLLNQGLPLANAAVTFTAPSSGASTLFSNSANSIAAVTNASGVATVTALTANGTTGSYTVTATVAGINSSASFNLTNTAMPVITVTTLTDDAAGAAGNCPGPGCSLRDAIAAAAAIPQTTLTPVTTTLMPTITFAGALNLSAAAPGTYNVTTGGTLTIAANMNITGPGANLLSISGNNSYQVFNVSSGVTANISGLTITAGSSTANGGGILNNGTLTVSNSAITGNTSANGGGIYNSAGNVTVSGSTISGNTSGYGGGIFNSAGTVMVSNSTVSGNASGYGGGIYLSSAKLTLADSAVGGNSATHPPGAGIGGDAASSVVLANDLISDTMGAGPVYTDNGGNAIAGMTSGVTASSIELASLGSYGGPTQTMPPLPGSAGICAGTSTLGNDVLGNAMTLPSTDQRGNPRSTTAYGASCVDAGAVQTAYSLAFSTEPANTSPNMAILPSPAVQLYDNGIAIALSDASITVSDSKSDLNTTGTLTASTGSNGIATFSNLSFSTVAYGDKLTALATSYGPNIIIASSTGFDVKLAATVTLENLLQAYTGSPLSATVTTAPASLAVSLTYNGSATPPTAVGSYAVVATVNDSNYAGSVGGTLVITKAAATVTLGNLLQAYTSAPLTATATTAPANLAVRLTYNGSATAPTAVGSYAVVATVTDSNYSGSVGGTLVIAKATATVTLGNLSQTYTGSPLSATATTAPANLAVSLTYNGSATAPTAAGSYAVAATVNDLNYTGTSRGRLVIARAVATVALSNLSQTYTGSALTAISATTPANLAVSLTYNGSPTGPSTAGYYVVSATITDSNYTGTAEGVLIIAKATATIALSGLSQTYTGSPFAAAATTTPANLTVSLTYNGSSTPPTAVGSYAVVATITDSNYTGTAGGTLTISPVAQTINFPAPASPVIYGVSPISLSASGGASGNPVIFSVVSGSGSITANSLSITGAGTVIVTANQAGNINYTAATMVQQTIVVNEATAQIGLLTSSNPVLAQNAITLTATVFSTTGTPTGTVRFMDGTTPIGSGALVGGMATLITSGLTAGSHSLTVVYSGDFNFSSLTSSALTQTVEDFTLNTSASGGGSTQTVTAGQEATYTLTMNPPAGMTLPDSVNLTVYGLPPGASATITPQTLPAGSSSTNVTLKIQTSAASAYFHREAAPGKSVPPLLWGILVFPFASRVRLTGKRLGQSRRLLLLLALGAAVMSGVSGCSGNSSSTSTQTYLVTLTATSGSLSHSVSVTLVVE